MASNENVIQDDVSPLTDVNVGQQQWHKLVVALWKKKEEIMYTFWLILTIMALRLRHRIEDISASGDDGMNISHAPLVNTDRKWWEYPITIILQQFLEELYLGVGIVRGQGGYILLWKLQPMTDAADMCVRHIIARTDGNQVRMVSSYSQHVPEG